MDSPPPFRIVFDADTATLHLTLCGFWTKDTLGQFAAALGMHAAQAGRHRADFSILSDATDFPIQSPEVADGFERITAGGASRHVGLTAIVVPSALGRMQAQRVLGSDRVRIFADLAAAKAWLAAERTDG